MVRIYHELMTDTAPTDCNYPSLGYTITYTPYCHEWANVNLFPPHDYRKNRYYFLVAMLVIVHEKVVPVINPTGLCMIRRVAKIRKALVSFRLFMTKKWYQRNK